MRQQTGRTVREARALGQHRTRRARSTLARIGRLPARLPVAEADACAAETCRPPAAIWNRSGRRSASPTLPLLLLLFPAPSSAAHTRRSSSIFHSRSVDRDHPTLMRRKQMLPAREMVMLGHSISAVTQLE